VPPHAFRAADGPRFERAECLAVAYCGVCLEAAGLFGFDGRLSRVVYCILEQAFRLPDETSPMLSSSSQKKLGLAPIASEPNFTEKAYAALKDVITRMDLYGSRAEIRLDERQLASDLGVSRTPVREALAQLEREGFVRSIPRRGIYVVRKTRSEVIELITAWAALEGMAARLATENAGEDEITALRRMFTTFEGGEVQAKLDEYSEVNIEFHQAIIRMSHNRVLIDMAENLFTHMRMIRRKTIGEMDRADRSIRDHMHIIEALEARNTNRAEELVRSHALGLAEHVARHADYLD